MLRKSFFDARQDETLGEDEDANMELLASTLKNEIPIHVNARRALTIRAALKVADEYGLQLTLQECRQLGYESVWLGVWDQNLRARKFYERFGYKKIGKKHFILGSDKQEDAVYLLDLR